MVDQVNSVNHRKRTQPMSCIFIVKIFRIPCLSIINAIINNTQYSDIMHNYIMHISLKKPVILPIKLLSCLFAELSLSPITSQQIRPTPYSMVSSQDEVRETNS